MFRFHNISTVLNVLVLPFHALVFFRVKYLIHGCGFDHRAPCVHVLCVCVSCLCVSASFPLCGLMRQEGPNPSVCDCISQQGPWIKHVYTTDTPVSLNQARKRECYSVITFMFNPPYLKLPFFLCFALFSNIRNKHLEKIFRLSISISDCLILFLWARASLLNPII